MVLQSSSFQIIQDFRVNPVIKGSTFQLLGMKPTGNVKIYKSQEVPPFNRWINAKVDQLLGMIPRGDVRIYKFQGFLPFNR